MVEYIDRQAALDALCEGTFEDAEISIRSIPAADVAPVVHGEWQQTEYPIMSECEDCSECGYRTMYGHGFKFCPNCGTLMDGKEEEHG